MHEVKQPGCLPPRVEPLLGPTARTPPQIRPRARVGEERVDRFPNPPNITWTNGDAGISDDLGYAGDS